MLRVDFAELRVRLHQIENVLSFTLRSSTGTLGLLGGAADGATSIRRLEHTPIFIIVLYINVIVLILGEGFLSQMFHNQVIDVGIETPAAGTRRRLSS